MLGRRVAYSGRNAAECLAAMPSPALESAGRRWRKRARPSATARHDRLLLLRYICVLILLSDTGASALAPALQQGMSDCYYYDIYVFSYYYIRMRVGLIYLAARLN